MNNNAAQDVLTSPQQGEKTGNTAHLATRARPLPKGRITWAIAESVAALVAMRGTEREACAAIQPPLSYSTWMHWKGKARNAEQFQKLVDRITASKIEFHLKNVENAATGQGGFEKRDWRASIEYLKAAIPRYQPGPSATAAVQISVDAKAPYPEMVEYTKRVLNKLFATPKNAKGAIVDVKAEPVKQLPEKCDIPVSDVSRDKETRHV